MAKRVAGVSHSVLVAELGSRAAPWRRRTSARASAETLLSELWARIFGDRLNIWQKSFCRGVCVRWAAILRDAALWAAAPEVLEISWVRACGCVALEAAQWFVQLFRPSRPLILLALGFSTVGVARWLTEEYRITAQEALEPLTQRWETFLEVEESPLGWALRDQNAPTARWLVERYGISEAEADRKGICLKDEFELGHPEAAWCLVEAFGLTNRDVRARLPGYDIFQRKMLKWLVGFFPEQGAHPVDLVDLLQQACGDYHPEVASWLAERLRSGALQADLAGLLREACLGKASGAVRWLAERLQARGAAGPAPGAGAAEALGADPALGADFPVPRPVESDSEDAGPGPGEVPGAAFPVPLPAPGQVGAPGVDFPVPLPGPGPGPEQG
jgi:hypothetical protein